MPATILGLDVGGANLKAATADKQATSVPFALWKQPDKLPAALAELVAKFPDVEELAVTMTGELCDCFETKRAGVHAIIAAIRFASGGRRIRVWSTDGAFVDSEVANRDYLKVAAANWHALATLAGQYVPNGRAILVDVGSTTTDVIPIVDGTPVPEGKTDHDRIATRELLYTGVRRTPLCSILGFTSAAELFATTLDVYLTLGMVLEDPADTDTADGRPATKAHAHARLSRMLGGDSELISTELTGALAERVHKQQVERIGHCVRHVRTCLEQMPTNQWDSPFSRQIRREPHGNRGFQETVAYVVSGSGEFLAREGIDCLVDPKSEGLSLTDRLGPEVSACAPAYAVAVLATEGPPPPGGNWLRGLWPWCGHS